MHHYIPVILFHICSAIGYLQNSVMLCFDYLQYENAFQDNRLVSYFIHAEGISILTAELNKI